MGEIVNLRRVRRERAKQDQSQRAAANRAKHGRTKAELEATEKRQKLLEHRLDSAQIDPIRPEPEQG